MCVVHSMFVVVGKLRFPANGFNGTFILRGRRNRGCQWLTLVVLPFSYVSSDRGSDEPSTCKNFSNCVSWFHQRCEISSISWRLIPLANAVCFMRTFLVELMPLPSHNIRVLSDTKYVAIRYSYTILCYQSPNTCHRITDITNIIKNENHQIQYLIQRDILSFCIILELCALQLNNICRIAEAFFAHPFLHTAPLASPSKRILESAAASPQHTPSASKRINGTPSPAISRRIPSNPYSTSPHAPNSATHR